MTRLDPVAWGMVVDGRVLYVISQREHARCPGDFTLPLYTADQMRETIYKETESVWMDAKRLALELECLLMSCDLPAASKWWDSAHAALELHRELVREKQEQA